MKIKQINQTNKKKKKTTNKKQLIKNKQNKKQTKQKPTFSLHQIVSTTTK
jgi:hypothetical protein